MPYVKVTSVSKGHELLACTRTAAKKKTFKKIGETLKVLETGKEEAQGNILTTLGPRKLKTSTSNWHFHFKRSVGWDNYKKKIASTGTVFFDWIVNTILFFHSQWVLFPALNESAGLCLQKTAQTNCRETKRTRIPRHISNGRRDCKARKHFEFLSSMAPLLMACTSTGCSKLQNCSSSSFHSGYLKSCRQ